MIIAAILALVSSACAASTGSEPPVVRVGIEVLEGRGFEGLIGKRVGLVTNPSGVDRNLRSTIDILFSAPEVSRTGKIR